MQDLDKITVGVLALQVSPFQPFKARASWWSQHDQMLDSKVEAFLSYWVDALSHPCSPEDISRSIVPPEQMSIDDIWSAIALQGSFHEHVVMLNKLHSVVGREVRTIEQLQAVQSLIIPGGIISFLRSLTSLPGYIAGFVPDVHYLDLAPQARARQWH